MFSQLMAFVCHAPHRSFLLLMQIMDSQRKRSNSRILLAGKLASATNVPKIPVPTPSSHLNLSRRLFAMFFPFIFFGIFLATFYCCYLKSSKPCALMVVLKIVIVILIERHKPSANTQLVATN